MQNTEENLKKIQLQIRDFEKKYQRDAMSVQLMAVSKKKPVSLIEQAYHAGQRIFGESYVQEVLLKQRQLGHLMDLEWHFIGPIQSNKTKDIALNFNWVHSVDRMKIAHRLSEQRPADMQAINVCLQVNIDHEGSKSGFYEDDLLAAAESIMLLPNVTLRGLMAIPKPCNGLSLQRLAFRRVQQLYKTLQSLSKEVDTLSIGMSNDMQAAIAEGSTIVRVGTAIFGNRV